MVEATQHERAKPPVLLSRLACLGVLVIVALSTYVGFTYWWSRDQALSILTVGAEIIACFGLATAWGQFPKKWGRGLGAIMLTLVAASWCALTLYQKINDDSARDAVTQARETPAFIFSSNAARTAQTLLRDRLSQPDPRPTCNCPQTVAAWEAAEASAINRLRAERDEAVRQMQAAIPPPQISLIAVARGVGIELTKLFGFTVFWLAVAPIAVGAPSRRPFEVVEGGLNRLGAPVARPVRAGVSILAGVAAWWAMLTQQTPPHPASPAVPPQPVEHMGDIIQISDLAPEAARLAAQRLGERRIAAQLTSRSGLEVTRWQVRKMLGRVAA